MRDDLQELVDEVSRLLAAPATLEDAEFTLLAFCAHDDSSDATMDAVRQARGPCDVQGAGDAAPVLAAKYGPALLLGMLEQPALRLDGDVPAARAQGDGA